MNARNPSDVDTPVLIVGGGPVGLALALELGTRGIDCTLVDARDGAVEIPKMTAVSARTVEFCRRWGIADAVEDAAWPADHPQDFVYLTSMTGYELARTPWPPRAMRPESDVTPNGNLHCPQIYFDPVLRRRAETLPHVRLRYRTAMESFAEPGDGVTARLTDTVSGAGSELRARYLVGCDGADSTVRERLAIAWEGEGRLSFSLSIYFRAPALAAAHDKGWARFFRLVDHGGNWADLVAIDGKELWRLTLLRLEASADPDQVDIPAIMRRAFGADLPYEVLSVLPWERRDQIAARYARGRVFLAGDSAHQLSPTGGLGMNTGIADAVDLGWKLAAVLAGWGGVGLLDSYEAERKPMAHLNVSQSTAYFRRTRGFPGGADIARDTAEGAKLRRGFKDEFDRQERDGITYISEHLKLGYCYEPSPICVPDGTDAPEITGVDYIANARPGARAPHLWLGDRRSMLDLFGDGFTLLRLGAAPPEVAPLADAASRWGVPLTIVDVTNRDAEALYHRRLVLVRPDGHVAWRGDDLPDDAPRLIDVVRGGI